MDKRKNIENIYPLAPMQQGILFHTLLAPESGAYAPQIVLTLEGALDVAGLQQAWQQALSQHDVLRTGFYWEQRDEPFQVVYRQLELTWVQQDWRGQPADIQATRLQIFLDCNQTQPFDLHKPPLVRLALMQLDESRYQLIFAYHHLILDGWSAANLLKTVFAQYFSIIRSVSLPAPTPPPYTAYLTWLKAQDPAAAQPFWQTYLQGFTEPTSPPIWRLPAAPPEAQATQRTEQNRLLSQDQTAQLRRFAQQHQLTLNTLIQAALALLLSRYCDRDDVVFGATCAGRPPALPGAEAMVGLFINTLPVRVRVPDAEVVPWLQQLQGDRATASAYEYSPLMDVQTWSELPAGQALFDCLLVVENYPVNADMLAGQSALALSEVQFVEWTHFPLTLLVATGEQLTLTAKYSQHRVTDAAIQRLLAHLEMLLLELTTQTQLRDVSLLTAAEVQQLQDWNQTAANYPHDHTLTELMAAQVEQTPDAIAVQFKDETLTYRDLDHRAHQLAQQLQSLGVGPEVPVAVCVERSPDLVVALLGILQAGGAYLPIDPSYPRDRLSWMLQDAAPPVLITHPATQTLADTLSSESDHIQQLNLHPTTPLPHHPTPPPPFPFPTPDNAIYILYTSGSTGRPKGVINTHRGLVNRLCWMQDTYSLTPGDRVLQKTPLSFDVSAWEFFWPLLTGATLVLARPDGHKDSAYLAELIQQAQITTLHFVPSMLAAFLEAPEAAQCNSLKRVICSGEALPTDLQTRFFQTLPNVELHNLYGPTEAAIDVTAWACQPDDDASPTVPIGRPIANTQIHLLDSLGRLVPPGIPGELHIGGVGVARGYLNRPDLTAEKFVPNPLEQGAGDGRQETGDRRQEAEEPYSLFPIPCSPLYRTGDRARYRPDGAIEFLGRIDDQVKLRGFRIELGEIEAVLTQHPEVAQATVVLRSESEQTPQLVAYVVQSTGSRMKDEEAWERGVGGAGKRENLDSPHLPIFRLTSEPISPTTSPPTWCRLSSWRSTHCRCCPTAKLIAGPCLRPIARNTRQRDRPKRLRSSRLLTFGRRCCP